LPNPSFCKNEEYLLDLGLKGIGMARHVYWNKVSTIILKLKKINRLSPDSKILKNSKQVSIKR
jgi:hypothetical protein